MIVVKFQKRNTKKYQSQLDILSQVTRVFGRANIEIKYSEGFNPHKLLFFNAPIPVGVESVCEYFAVVTNEDGTSFLKKYNDNVSEDLKAIEVFETNMLDIANFVNCAKFLIKIQNLNQYENAIKNYFNNPIMTIQKKVKGIIKPRNIKPLIISYKILDNELEVVLYQGQVNLRPDDLINDLIINNVISEDDYCYEIIKTESYFEKNNIITTVDEILKKHAVK